MMVHYILGVNLWSLAHLYWPYGCQHTCFCCLNKAIIEVLAEKLQTVTVDYYH